MGIQPTDNNTKTTPGSDPKEMKKLCRHISIESPGPVIKDSVLYSEIPVPDVPPHGARIKVVCIGVCYRDRSSSTYNATRNSEYPRIVYPGIRDGAFFPGYEISGLIDELGSNVSPYCGFAKGQRVVLFPYEGIAHGYAEYVVIPNLSYLVHIPDKMSLGVAAMLPSGALLAKNAVIASHNVVTELLSVRPDKKIQMLIVGTEGLSLWALKIASFQFNSSSDKDKVNITVATLKDEWFELPNVNKVQWNECLYENQLVERTKHACSGMVDIVIDFGATLRSLQRSLQFLNIERGLILVNDEAAEVALKCAHLISENQEIKIVRKGNVQQLREIVQIVAEGQIIPPPHTEFSTDETTAVIQKLCKSEKLGRAILRFEDPK